MVDLPIGASGMYSGDYIIIRERGHGVGGGGEVSPAQACRQGGYQSFIVGPIRPK